MSKDATISVYSADWCAFCHATMDYLNKIGVKFDEKNVEEKQEYMEEAMQKSGQTGIPVIDIDGTIIVGFDRPKIDAALKDKKLV
jgi:glutaredoxin 3